MRWLWLAAFLVLGMILADGSDSSAIPEAGQALYYVGGAEEASEYQDFYDDGVNDAGWVEQGDGGTIQYMVSGSEPESLVVGGRSEPFDLSSVPMNSYWIQGTERWTQYIKCPMYARFKLLAYTQGGVATVREDYPDGTQMKKDFQFYPGFTSQTFTADAVGRHIIGFEVNGQMSNAVIVDVVDEGGMAEQPQVIPSSSSGKASTSPGFASGQGQPAGQVHSPVDTGQRYVDPGI